MKTGKSKPIKKALAFLMGFLVLMFTGKALLEFLACLSEKQCTDFSRSSRRDSNKSPKSSGKQIESDYSKLSKRQRNIMKLVDEGDSITVPELSENFPTVSDRTLRRDMNHLEDIGLVKRQGSTKATVYHKV